MGKMKARITLPAGADEKVIREAALAHEKVREAIGEREIRKVIVVPGRLVNIVVGK